ncbi:MAG: choice-of-anchor B family protein [Planctomycetes bacterium]|nr:choice-of-anchor B family protein [Planctomycetota bacterium]
MADRPSSVRSRLALALVAGLAAPLLAHDSVEFVQQRQAPSSGGGILGLTGSTVSFPSSGVSLMAWLPLSEFASSAGSDCWAYTSGSGREYAIMGTNASVGFVEVTDPGAPTVVAVFPAVASSWRDIKVYQDHAYWVSEGGDGIQVADMSAIDAGIVTLKGAVTSPGTTATHNLALDETSGILYRCGGGSSPVEGLRMYSLANKDVPAYVGSWSSRYVHDAQVVTYTSGPYAGKQVAFCFSESGSGGGSPGIDIVDVTNKASPSVMGHLNYSSPVFSHQGWLSPDRQYLYLNDELDEASFGTLTTTRIVNVSNLAAPTQVGTFTSGSTSIDHNLYTVGTTIYEANYRSGLRVFDASNPTAPVQTAFFDTYPPDDAAEFNGLWNVCPYLPSGTVIGSDIEKGLFVWRLGAPDLAFTIVGGAPELLSPNGDSFTVTIATAGGATLDASSARLHVDLGSGFVSLPMTDLGGGAFRADVPGATCGTQIEYYVSARTTSGVTWTDPPAAPTYRYGAFAATAINVLVDVDLESNPGWTVGAAGDTASTGIWTRVDPVGTAAQPEDDHTASGTQCFVTGQGLVGGGLGDNDVDGGKTTLTTGDFDLSSGDATISYWRWYSNGTGADPGNDVFVVDVSNNGGSSWTNVETVGPTGEGTLGDWIQHSFLVSDYVTPTANVRLRFVAEDAGAGSIIEAAVDDLRVQRFECATCQTDLGFGGPGDAQFTVCGEPLDTGNVAQLLLTQGTPSSLAVLFLGLVDNPTSFRGGLLVPVPFVISLSIFTDPSGEITFPLPGGGGPGLVYAQFAVVDPSQTYGVELSNALEIAVGP